MEYKEAVQTIQPGRYRHFKGNAVEERIQAARICGEGKMSASKIPAYNKYC